MKKWLIVLLVLFLIVGGIVGAYSYRLNMAYGWLPSESVSHDSVVSEEVRLRVAIDTLRLARDLEVYLPAETPLPRWLPWDLPQLLPRVLPREVALLGGPNFRTDEYNVVLFINEQRGGPALPEYINTRTRFRESFPGITWDEPGFTLQRRGVLTAQGHMEIPSGLEETLLELWSPELPDDRLALLGGHMAEGVVDNRNGDIVVLIATLAPIWGTSLEQLQLNPQFSAVMALLAGVIDLRLAVDFENPDTLLIQVRFNAEVSVGGQLEFFIPLTLPTMAQQLQQQYELEMKSEYAWVPEESTYVVDVSLTGVEEKFKTYFRQIIPAAPAAATTP